MATNRRLPYVAVLGIIIVSGAIALATTARRQKEKVYRYSSGSVRLREQYKWSDEPENITRSIWYLPDGAVFRVTVWDEGTGTGFYLDDEGRITSEIPYVDGIAEGPGFRFEHGEDGEIRVKVVRYSKGAAQE